MIGALLLGLLAGAAGLLGPRAAVAQMPEYEIASVTDGRSVTHADLDGDGAPDAVYVSRTSDLVAWSRNQGSGTFSSPQVVSTNLTDVRDVTVADFDGDGDLDLASASAGQDDSANEGKISWYENQIGEVGADSDGFGSQQVIEVNDNGLGDVEAGDVDGDGDPDVVWGDFDYPDRAAWNENQIGEGGADSDGFGGAQVFTSDIDGAWVRLTLTDSDGDGDLDVLVTYRNQYVNRFTDNYISLFENQVGEPGADSDGFAGRVDIETVAKPHNVVASDLNGDGTEDPLTLSGLESTLFWLPNQGGATFGSRQELASPSSIGAGLQVSDVNGDDALDILAAIGGARQMGFFKGDGSGNYVGDRIATTGTDDARGIDSTDVDGDGDTDLLAAHKNKIVWYENPRLSLTAPQVTGLRPKRATAGSVIRIFGDGFSPAPTENVVDFGGTTVTATKVDSKVLYVRVPSGVSGSVNLSVRTLGKTTAVPGQLTVLSGGPGAFPIDSTITTAAQGAFNVFVGDVDGDGDEDVLSASINDDTIAWYENQGGGTLGPQQVITTSADKPYSVYAADLDGDGDLDALSASANDNTVSWYENQIGESGADADGFGSRQNLTTSDDGASDVIAKDIDGDGDRDVITSSFGSPDRVSWYENQIGEGGADSDGFGARQVISSNAGGSWRDLHVADFDGDADVDVAVVGGQSNLVSWYENQVGEPGADGDGFGARVDISTNVDLPKSISAGDLDGDGDLDLLTASKTDDKIAWYENQGWGTFGSQQVITTNADGALSVSVGDVDGDGDLDPLSASRVDNVVAWYENAGSGSFTSREVTDNANGAWSVRAGDLDGDGDLDPVAASIGADKVAWYPNETVAPEVVTEAAGDVGSFELTAAGGVNPGGLQTRVTVQYGEDTSFGTDSTKTVATRLTEEDTTGVSAKIDSLNQSTTYNYRVQAQNSLGTTTGAVQTLTTPPAPPLSAPSLTPKSGTAGAIVHIRGQGFRPIAGKDTVKFGSATATINSAESSVLEVEVPSGLSGPVPVTVSTPESTVTAADRFTGLSGGPATFPVDSTVTTAPDGPVDVALGDVDGDGDEDVLSASLNDDTVAWYENAGGGSFGAQQVITTSANSARSVFVADLDGDGDLDALSASANDQKVAWYENQIGESGADSDGFGTQQNIATTLDGAGDVLARDLDGDGDRDIIACNFRTPDRVVWYENKLDTGGGFGSRKVLINANEYWNDLHAGDLDGDGDLDVAVTGGQGNVVTWFANQIGEAGADSDGFSARRDIGTPDFPGSVDGEDFDADGDLDLLVGSKNDDTVAWYPNRGSGTFGPPKVLSGRIGAPTDVAAGDLDGDGDPDVLYAAGADNEVGWFENDGTGGFSSGKIVSGNANKPLSVTPGDLDGDGDLDPIVAEESGDKVSWHLNTTIAPQVVTSAAGDTSDAGFIAEGSVNPGGDSTAVTVQYGEDTSFGTDSTVTANGSLAGDDTTTVGVRINGLASKTTYHYRVQAKNRIGGATGSVESVQTEGSRPLAVSGMEPTSGTPGTRVRIEGAGFRPTAGDNTVEFGSATATVDSVSGDRSVLVAEVPSDVSGSVSVSVTASNSTVTVPGRFTVLGEGPGTFPVERTIGKQAEGASDVAAGDLDGDGDLDVLSASKTEDTVVWYENQGGGAFGSPQVITTKAKRAWSVAAANLDGDGDLDVLSASADDGKIAFYENQVGESGADADGFGAQQVITRKAEGARAVLARDLDGDGDADVVSANLRAPERVAWHENKLGSGGGFGPQQVIVEADKGWNDLHAADLDGDGDVDVAATGEEGLVSRFANRIGEFGADADGFGPGTAVGRPGRPRAVAGGDLDGDGDEDLLVASSADNAVRWHPNRGDGTFGPARELSRKAGAPTDAEIGDLDGDGDLDVVVASGAGDSVGWFENEGSGAFSASRVVSRDPVTPFAVQAADLDGDADLDPVAAVIEEEKVTWYPNLEVTSFAVEGPSERPTVGTSVSLTAQVPEGIAPTTGTLFYRRAGARAFQRREVTVGEGSVEATIPASAVTERGVDYALRLAEPLSETDTFRVTGPGREPLRDPAHLQVKVPETKAGGPFRAKAYRMVSVPLVLEGRSVFEVLKKQYGAYDPEAWRLFRWSPVDSTYREGPSVSDSLAPGQAAWVITEEGDSLSVQGGRSVPADSAQALRLAPGWNQVGSPFAFPVSWSRIEGTGQVRAPKGYDASRPGESRYRDQSRLRPWRGSFVYNPTDTTVTLRVPPTEAKKQAPDAKKEPAVASAEGKGTEPEGTEPEGYRLQAIASMRVGETQYRDRQAWMGLKEGASPGVGEEDMAKPPGVGSRVRVVADPEEGPGLARSLKPAGGGAEGQSAAKERGASWDLRVSAQVDAPFQTKRTVTIQLAEQGARPDGFKRWVLDLDRERRLSATHGTVEIEVTEKEARHLRVIVGTKAFAEAASEDIGLGVAETKLGVNAPNPFAEETRISYQLAEPEAVRMEVYDVLGRRVRTLVKGEKEAGVHRVTLEAAGLASGVYFCRMEAGDYTETRKLTVVR